VAIKSEATFGELMRDRRIQCDIGTIHNLLPCERHLECTCLPIRHFEQSHGKQHMLAKEPAADVRNRVAHSPLSIIEQTLVEDTAPAIGRAD
jgi:hypothetical protein